MKNVIMYCPLNDSYIIELIAQFSLEKFKQDPGFFEEEIKLIGTNDFQQMICNLETIPVSSSEIFLFDTIVADSKNKHTIDVFWEKHGMEIGIPIYLPESLPNRLYFVTAAIMNLKTTWDVRHKAEKYDYTIPVDKSFSGHAIDVKGYLLSQAKIALDKDGNEISAYIALDNHISLQLSDLSAFCSREDQPHDLDELSLYKLVSQKRFSYYKKGFVIAPCIEELLVVNNHLKNMHWESSDTHYTLNVASSEALTKLKLSEHGVEARAETVTLSEIVLTCCAGSMEQTYTLEIMSGLVIDIRYDDKSIFVAYIPQENFEKQ